MYAVRSGTPSEREILCSRLRPVKRQFRGAEGGAPGGADGRVRPGRASPRARRAASTAGTRCRDDLPGRTPDESRDEAGESRSRAAEGPRAPGAAATLPPGTGRSPTEGGRRRGPALSAERPPRGAFPSAAPPAPGRSRLTRTGGRAPRPTGTTSSRRGRLPLPRTAGPGSRPAGRPHPPAGRTAGGPGARFPRGPAGP